MHISRMERLKSISANIIFNVENSRGKKKKGIQPTKFNLYDNDIYCRTIFYESEILTDRLGESKVG